MLSKALHSLYTGNRSRQFYPIPPIVYPCRLQAIYHYMSGRIEAMLNLKRLHGGNWEILELGNWEFLLLSQNDP